MRRRVLDDGKAYFLACSATLGSSYFLPMNRLASYITFLGSFRAWRFAALPTRTPPSWRKATVEAVSLPRTGSSKTLTLPFSETAATLYVVPRSTPMTSTRPLNPTPSTRTRDEHAHKRIRMWPDMLGAVVYAFGAMALDHVILAVVQMPRGEQLA